MTKVRIGDVEVDPVTMSEAIERVVSLVKLGRGGAVFTPNVDHVVLAREDARFREAYSRASLCVADGQPVVWASRLFGRPLPERVAGSDLFLPLMARAAELGLSVFLFGGRPHVVEAAAAKLTAMGVRVVGSDTPDVADPEDASALGRSLETIREAAPDLVVVSLGAPKQELFIDAHKAALGRSVALGLGGTLDFFVGEKKRAPAWMAENGLEWLYRLVQEPGRMYRRYLLRDPAFAFIVLRQLAALSGKPALGPGRGTPSRG